MEYNFYIIIRYKIFLLDINNMQKNINLHLQHGKLEQLITSSAKIQNDN